MIAAIVALAPMIIQVVAFFINMFNTDKVVAAQKIADFTKNVQDGINGAVDLVNARYAYQKQEDELNKKDAEHDKQS